MRIVRQMDDVIPRPGDPMPEVYPEVHRADFKAVDIHSPRKFKVSHRYRPDEDTTYDPEALPGHGKVAVHPCAPTVVDFDVCVCLHARLSR
jgi:hypothetical protein